MKWTCRRNMDERQDLDDIRFQLPPHIGDAHFTTALFKDLFTALHLYPTNLSTVPCAAPCGKTTPHSFRTVQAFVLICT